MSRSNSSASSGYVQNTPGTPTHIREMFNIVSLQSTARPGCIIELENIVDAKQVNRENLNVFKMLEFNNSIISKIRPTFFFQEEKNG